MSHPKRVAFLVITIAVNLFAPKAWGDVLKDEYVAAHSATADKARQGFEAIRKAAIAGDIRAQVMLGHMYWTGMPSPLNMQYEPYDAFDWLKKAADQGSGVAKLDIVTLYAAHHLHWFHVQNDIGFPTDPIEKYALFAEAARNRPWDDLPGRALEDLKEKMTPSQIQQAEVRAKALPKPTKSDEEEYLFLRGQTLSAVKVSLPAPLDLEGFSLIRVTFENNYDERTWPSRRLTRLAVRLAGGRIVASVNGPQVFQPEYWIVVPVRTEARLVGNLGRLSRVQAWERLKSGHTMEEASTHNFPSSRIYYILFDLRGTSAEEMERRLSVVGRCRGHKPDHSPRWPNGTSFTVEVPWKNLQKFMELVAPEQAIASDSEPKLDMINTGWGTPSGEAGDSPTTYLRLRIEPSVASESSVRRAISDSSWEIATWSVPALGVYGIYGDGRELIHLAERIQKRLPGVRLERLEDMGTVTGPTALVGNDFCLTGALSYWDAEVVLRRNGGTLTGIGPYEKNLVYARPLSMETAVGFAERIAKQPGFWDHPMKDSCAIPDSGNSISMPEESQGLRPNGVKLRAIKP